MLNEELFYLFLITGTANILAPGLGSVMTITLSLQHGWRKSIAGCAGLAVGIQILFILAVSGLGVIIAASPTLFALIKTLGACYLLYLGFKNFFKDASRTAGLLKHAEKQQPENAAAQFGKCVLVSITNPQPIVFGISVLPQFIDAALPYVPQVSIMIAVYGVMVFIVMLATAILASHARRFLSGPSGPKIVNCASGAVFVAIAAWVLAQTFLVN